MENASKALVIAGAILVSIILVSLGIVVINQVKSKISNANITSEEVQAFNSKFDTYLGDINGTQANQLNSLCRANGVTFTVQGAPAGAATGFNASAQLTATITGYVENGENRGKISEITVATHP